MPRFTKYKYGIAAASALAITSGTFILFDARRRIQPQDYGIPWLISAERCIATQYKAGGWETITQQVYVHTITGAYDTVWYGPGNTGRTYQVIGETLTPLTTTRPRPGDYRAAPYSRTNVWTYEHTNRARYIRGPFEWLIATGYVHGLINNRVNSKFVFAEMDSAGHNNHPRIKYTNVQGQGGAFVDLFDTGFIVGNPTGGWPAAYFSRSLPPALPSGDLIQTTGKQSWAQNAEGFVFGWSTGLRIVAHGPLITNRVTTSITQSASVTNVATNAFYYDAPVLTRELHNNAIVRPTWEDFIGFSKALSSAVPWYVDLTMTNAAGNFEGTSYVHQVIPTLTFSQVLVRTGVGLASGRGWTYVTNALDRRISSNHLIEVYTVGNYLDSILHDDDFANDQTGWINDGINNKYVWRSPPRTLASEAISIAETAAPSVSAISGGPVRYNLLKWDVADGGKVVAEKVAIMSKYRVQHTTTDIVKNATFYTYAGHTEVNTDGFTNTFKTFGDLDIESNRLTIIATMTDQSGTNIVTGWLGTTSKPPNDWPSIAGLDTNPPVTTFDDRIVGYQVSALIRKVLLSMQFSYGTNDP